MKSNWELTGHEWAVNLLRRQVASGEVRHAYLFAGPNGVGRRTLALKFAQALNCTNPPAPGEYCGECKNCKQISVMRQSDFVITPPLIKDGSLGVDRLRATQHLISRTPFQSKYRVSLFPDFQAATEEAQNALLKTLEEPPAYAVMILTANDPEQLLPTIVSRCEVIRLKPLGVQKVEKMLREDNLEPEKARLFAHIGEGLPGYAKELLTDKELMQNRLQRLDELKTILRGNRVERFAYAGALAKAKCTDIHVEEHIILENKEQQQLESVKKRCILRHTYPIWLSFWRDVLLRTTGADIPITNIDYEDQVNALAARMDVAAARLVVANLELGIGRLERNVNTQLLTEVILLDWPKL